ncbi:LolA family protein [Chitinophagaceae bacterium MMS25-I14]
MIRFCCLLFVCLLMCVLPAKSQSLPADQLFYKLRDKVSTVKDYVADVKMKIDVSFMRVPPLSGKLYFKYPDKIKLERSGGIAILPKKTVNMSLNNMMPAGVTTVIDAGYDTVAGIKVRVIKVVPGNEEADIVLTKLWIDENRVLAMRSETTTRENGTLKMDLEYGRFLSMSLPDKVILSMDVNDYKLPKGVTMDYDEGAGQTEMVQQANHKRVKKGRIQITYLSYKVNTGLEDSFFAGKK